MTNPCDKVKAMFMALHLGQKVFRYNEYIQHVYELMGGLLLRSIDQITDEEVIECGKVGFDFFNCIGCEYKLKVIRERKVISLAAVSLDEKTCLVKIPISDVWKLNVRQIDYLRSIGILIPFREYSTADILSFGWAKIKEV